MKKSSIFPIFLVLVTGILSQSVDEIINKHIEAIGGLENIKNVKTLIMKGTLTTHGINLNITITFKRELKVRMDIKFRSQSQSVAFDGTTAWRSELDEEGVTTDKMDDKEAEDLKYFADFEGMLADYKIKGYSVAYSGTEKIDKNRTYKIGVTGKSIDTVYYYVDTTTFLVLKRSRINKSDETTINTCYRSYKEYGGLKFPASFETKTDNGGDSQLMVFDNVEINTKVDDSIFKMPEVKN